MNVFITGGTGSFGHKFLERVKHDQFYKNDYSIEKVYVYSRDEKKQYDLRCEYPSWNYLNLIIGDVRDRERLEQIFPKDVDVVLNAAALKHVPACEEYPIEAIKTNVLGAFNVMEVAKKFKVKKYLAISTDKGCRPISSYGITKALQEKLTISSNSEDRPTIFSCVRYGNVMNSRGSVIPLFVEKAKMNKPLPITDKNMTRFLMSLEDSVDLVLTALRGMKGREIFIYKAKSCRIEDLAKAIIKRYGAYNDIEYVGIRPGEKIHEELISEDESLVTQDLDEKYSVIYPQSVDKLNEEPESYSSDKYIETNIDNIIKTIENIIEGRSSYDFKIRFP